MQTVTEIARDILAREGGFVNDPADPGGPTNHGVTLDTLRRLGRDLNGDGTVNIADVKSLSAGQAEAIFITEYFEKPRIRELPACLQPSVFDMSVNAGHNAIRLLQQLLFDMGLPLAIDGVIGAATLAAAHKAADLAPDHLADAYGIARRNYYYRLADRHPNLRKFARRHDGGKGGWILRAEAFISPRFHLSAAEHRARVAAWG